MEQNITSEIITPAIVSLIDSIAPLNAIYHTAVVLLPPTQIIPADATYKGVGGRPKGPMAAHSLDVRKRIETTTVTN